MSSKSVVRGTRVINRNFSLAEYGSGWTKIERYLFIEIYNVIKEFYMAKNDTLIKDFNSESIVLDLPIDLLNKKLFKVKHRSEQLAAAAKGLMGKTIGAINTNASGQTGFHFVNMFVYIKYDPTVDKTNIEIKIPKEIYNDMIPIESYALLDLVLLDALNSGSAVRLYEVFKSYAFQTQFKISFIDLRRQLGFYQEGKYEIWKYFNNQVLKPAVSAINKHKEFDIEVLYRKERGSDQVQFQVIQHKKDDLVNAEVLSLDQWIDQDSRKLNMIQKKYITTLIKNCDPKKLISKVDELFEWIISDLIVQQNKQGDDFDFKKSANAISKQIREGKYSMPYAHKHLAETN